MKKPDNRGLNHMPGLLFNLGIKKDPTIENHVYSDLAIVRSSDGRFEVIIDLPNTNALVSILQ